MTNVKPATPLPWHIGVNRPEATKMYALIEGADRSYPARVSGPDAAEDAAYIVTVANAYPKLVKDQARLVAALRDAWKGDLTIERYAQIGALLSELEEKKDEGLS